MGKLGEMDSLKKNKHLIVLLGLQFTYVGVALCSKAALDFGVSPSAFVAYRQAVATLVISSIAYFGVRKNASRAAIGVKSFCIMFMALFLWVTMYQNLQFEGMCFASSSVAAAMTNLVVAVTFIVTASLGWEKVDIISSMKSMVKVLGTLVCLSGAIFIAILKAQKVLNVEFPTKASVLLLGGDWLTGCLHAVLWVKVRNLADAETDEKRRDESSESCKIDLKEPLLTTKLLVLMRDET